MKNFTRLLSTVLVLCCVAGTTVQADEEITDVYLPESGATSLTYKEIVAAMKPDTNVHVENTFGSLIELYGSGTTSYIPANSYGLTIDGTKNTAKLKVLTDGLNEIQQTTVSTNGYLEISSRDGTTNHFYNNLSLDGGDNGKIVVNKATFNILQGAKISVSSGTMTIKNNLRLGYDTSSTKTGPAVIEQTGGRVELTQTDQTNYAFKIGYYNGSSGEYKISGGTLSCYIPVQMGDQSGSSGKVTISGTGIFKAKTTTTLGVSAGSTGEIILTGGEYLAGEKTGETRIGNSGTGTLTLNGGTFTQYTNWLNLGYEETGVGTLNLNGGTLNYVSINDFRVGRKGTGVFNMDSGAVNLGTKNLVIGYYATGNGTLNMTGGTINCYDIIIASSGTGTANIKSGSLGTSAHDIYIGQVAGSTGTLNMYDGSTVTAKTLALGAGTANVNMYGGTLNLGTGGITTSTGTTSIKLEKGTITAGSDVMTSNKGSWSSVANMTLTGTKTDSADNRVTFKSEGEYSITLSGTLSGDGGLIKSGNGVLELQAQNSYAGGTQIDAGTVKLTGNGSLGTGAVVLNGGKLEVTSSPTITSITSQTTGSELLLHDGATLSLTSASTIGKLNSSADVTTEYVPGVTQLATLQTNDAITIQGASEFYGLIKAQNASEKQTITFKASSSDVVKLYSPSDTDKSIGNFIVASGRVDMKGYYIGSLKVKADATLSPGNSIGSLYMEGDVTMDSGSTLLLEIAGADASANDQIVITNGKLTIGNGALIYMTLADNSSLGPNDTFTVNINATFADDGGASQEAFEKGLKSYYFKDFNLDVSSGTIKITGTVDPNAVPEPSTWALLILGFVGLMKVARKRERR